MCDPLSRCIGDTDAFRAAFCHLKRRHCWTMGPHCLAQGKGIFTQAVGCASPSLRGLRLDTIGTILGTEDYQFVPGLQETYAFLVKVATICRSSSFTKDKC